jgi:hypothetical protein
MEHSLFDPPYNQENGQATTARKAADALFTPKQEHPALSAEPESAVARKPRILAALQPAQPEVATPAVSPNPEKRRPISKSQIEHIRTWLKYGMTVRQAADVCGVSVSELKHALR